MKKIFVEDQIQKKSLDLSTINGMKYIEFGINNSNITFSEGLCSLKKHFEFLLETLRSEQCNCCCCH